MGDFRASIKIDASIFGCADKIDMWINYEGKGEVNGVDDRIVMFFRDLYERAYAEYQNELYEAERAERESREELSERQLLKMLKEKYEP